MQFVMLIYETGDDFNARSDRQGPLIGAWRAYYKSLVDAGVYVSGAPLQPDATGTTVRLKDGQRQVQDGPYADTKEQLGGIHRSSSCPLARRGARVGGPLPDGRDGRHRDSTGVGIMSATWWRAGMDDARGAIELVARESYGRLVAYLSSRTGDVAGAEDALGDAFMAALRTWPRDGVPKSPEGWLLTTARHKLIDRARHERIDADATPTLRHLVRQAEEISTAAEFPDDRLKLLFVCAHPAIDRSVHTPLMLQVVLGLDAAAIAGAFLTLPATMGQRLSRAKTKIRDTAIAFENPESPPAGRPARGRARRNLRRLRERLGRLRGRGSAPTGLDAGSGVARAGAARAVAGRTRSQGTARPHVVPAKRGAVRAEVQMARTCRWRNRRVACGRRP